MDDLIAHALCPRNLSCYKLTVYPELQQALDPAALLNSWVKVSLRARYKEIAERYAAVQPQTGSIPSSSLLALHGNHSCFEPHIHHSRNEMRSYTMGKGSVRAFDKHQAGCERQAVSKPPPEVKGTKGNAICASKELVKGCRQQTFLALGPPCTHEY